VVPDDFSFLLFVRGQSRIYGGESPLTFPDKLRAVILGTVPFLQKIIYQKATRCSNGKTNSE